MGDFISQVPEQDQSSVQPAEEQICHADIAPVAAVGPANSERIADLAERTAEERPEDMAAPSEESSGWGIMDWVHTGLDLAGLIPGVGEIADGINALAYAAEGDTVNAGLSAAAMVPFLGWGATTAKVGGKVVKGVKAANNTADATKAVGNALSPRAARRQAMRDAGIPTSQQPIRQRSVREHPNAPPAGRQYDYDVNGQPYSVQHSLTDDVPGHGPHWEAGQVKDGGQTDGVGRPRLRSDKAKVEE